ncbi:MAG: GNAT family N-acetyltransferase [Gaiellaceae bacterium]
MAPDFTLRAPRADEVEAIAALVNELARALHGVDAVEPDEVRKWFSGPSVAPEHDFRVAELADGTLAGLGSVVDIAEDHAILWLRVVLHPLHGTTEIGEALMDAADARAHELGGPGSLVHAQCAGKDERAAKLYGRWGYRLVRHVFRMQVELDAPQPPAWPEGFELRPLDVERDLERVFEADEEAFADHWGFARISFEAWRHWMTGGNFDPALWFLAYCGEEIAGFSLCQPQEAGDPDLGWVGVLGVRRPWRRRGLASALLQHSFVELHSRGRKRAGLSVDAENTTGALGLYERAGMRVVRRFDTWEKAL